MKKSIATRFVTVALMLMLIIMIGCASAEEVESQSQEDVEIAQDQGENAQAEEKKSEKVEEQIEEATPEPTNVPEPTPEPVEIDEKYEYHIYSEAEMSEKGTKNAKPIIGVNLPEGWHDDMGGHAMMNEKLIAIGFCDASYYNSIHISTSIDITSSQMYSEVLNKEEKATLPTPFGEAIIYWVEKAQLYDTPLEIEYYNSYADESKKIEKEGKKYILDPEEVAVLSIKGYNVYFSYQSDSYEGKLEVLLPQMLEVE